MGGGAPPCGGERSLFSARSSPAPAPSPGPPEPAILVGRPKRGGQGHRALARLEELRGTHRWRLILEPLRAGASAHGDGAGPKFLRACRSAYGQAGAL